MHKIKVLVIIVLISFMMVSTISIDSTPGSDPMIRVNQQRLEKHIHELAKYGQDPAGGTSRVAYSKADIEGRAYVMQLMQAAGLEVTIDQSGNIIGRRKGKDNSKKPIAFGSHIDTVPNGGNYDGCVGSLSAIEVVETLNENKLETAHPLEIIIFSNEEGGLVGSRALAGNLGPEALKEVSSSGLTIEQGIKVVGGEPGKLKDVARELGDLSAYIELHVEQGGILEKEHLQIGIVEGIVAIEWWEVQVDGFANHAGTTPMNMRKDALLAASELIIAINHIVLGYEGNQVGTVGKIKVEPGAPNVIPGNVSLSLEIRDLSSDKIWKIFQDIEQKAEEIANTSGTTISFRHIDAAATPAMTDKLLKENIKRAAEQLGLSYKLMPSGAGHDAQEIAQIAPIGMIFVPSVGGISHSPQEFTRTSDMANGANVLLHTILELDKDLK
jgi:beta-ureidopropionase / N-carbamoyl-L-amino-acid hydrolase